MFAISLSGLFITVAKLMCLIVVAAFSALTVLWPVSKQPISKTQKVIFAILNVIMALFLFGAIKLTD